MSRDLVLSMHSHSLASFRLFCHQLISQEQCTALQGSHSMQLKACCAWCSAVHDRAQGAKAGGPCCAPTDLECCQPPLHTEEGKHALLNMFTICSYALFCSSLFCMTLRLLTPQGIYRCFLQCGQAL